MFAVSSGFLTSARAGYFDPVLGDGAGRATAAVGHWVASSLPGALVWGLVGGAEWVLLPDRLPDAYRLSSVTALTLVSAIGWLVTLPLSRWTGAVLWTACLVTVASSEWGGELLQAATVVVPEGGPASFVSTLGTVVLCPFLLLTSIDSAPARADIVALGGLGVVVAALLQAVEHEVFAVHDAFGRIRERVVPEDDRPEVFRLSPTPVVKGRLWRERTPLSGVPVQLFPSPAELAAALDPIDYVAASAQSDAEGRFELALPPRGSGTLRIGGGPIGARRIQLPASDSLPAVTDLGDIHFAAPVRLEITLAPDVQCPVRAAGPLEHSGLSVVEASGAFAAGLVFELPEPGRWVLWAQCDDVELAVLPAVVHVAPTDTVIRIHLRSGGVG